MKEEPKGNSERAGILPVFVTAESPTMKQHPECNRYSGNTAWIDGRSEGGRTEDRKKKVEEGRGGGGRGRKKELRL